VVATVLVTVVGMGFGTWTPIAWGMIQEFVPADMVGRVMEIYTAVATATSLAGISFFGWLTEQANEYISMIGIGCVLFLLGLAAALFSRRIAAGGDSTDETEADPATVASGFA
jgi:MFS family permease